MCWIMLSGLMAGLLGSLMGIGGGIIAVPFLNLMLKGPMHQAAAAGLVSTISVSCMASGSYLRKGLVNLEFAFVILAFTTTGGLLGGFLAGMLKSQFLQVLFAMVLLYSAWDLMRRHKTQPSELLNKGPNLFSVLAYGLCFLAGIFSGLLGIGGGVIVVPVLYLFMGLPFKQATATSAFVMGFTALPALLGFMGREQLVLSIAIPLGVGVVLGAWFGAWLMPQVRTSWLKWIFAIVLIVTAMQMGRQGIGSW